MNDYDPKEVAKYEIGWWRAHHQKKWPKVLGNMAEVYIQLYGIKQEDAIRVVTLRLDAAKEHDLAETLEDVGNEVDSETHWKKAEDLLIQHFTLLKEAQERSKK